MQSKIHQTFSILFVLSMLHHKNECILYKIECNSIASTCFWVPVQMTASICTRLPLRSYSPERRQLQLLQHWPWAVSAFWCRAKRRCHASFGRTRGVAPRPLHGVLETRQQLLAATYNIGFQCRIYIYNVRLESSSSLKKFKTKLLASSTLSSLWCQVEGNKHVLRMDRSTACLLATLSHGSLRNITTARRKNQMHWMHWTRTYRMYMDVHGCTMHSSNESLGGKGPSELMLSIHPAPQWLEVTNNVYIYIHISYIILYIIYIIHDVAWWFPVLIQSDCLKFREFVGASLFQLKALERLLVLALALKSRHQKVATEIAAAAGTR